MDISTSRFPLMLRVSHSFLTVSLKVQKFTTADSRSHIKMTYLRLISERNANARDLSKSYKYIHNDGNKKAIIKMAYILSYVLAMPQPVYNTVRR